jgi:S1-C subfamily serine protease
MRGRRLRRQRRNWWAGATTLAPPRVPYPLHPLPAPPSSSGKRRRLYKVPAKDPRTNLPTVVKPKDPYTAESVSSPREKALIQDAARSVVSVSAIAHDGKFIKQCTGICIGWKETNKCARILTSSGVVCTVHPNFKLHICLPNRAVVEGQLLFFSNYYDIALLEISSESDLPLQTLSFGSNPNYGQEVFMLGRGEKSNLVARHGKILWLEDPDGLVRNYHMFLNCETPKGGTGGPVIDNNGNVTGMAIDNGGPNLSILSISTILTCIKMWMKFSRIARPVHGLSLRTVEMLDVSLQEVISLDHNINNGYIVDRVDSGSTAEKLGIRYGDVILSFDGRVQSLPQLEDYLLSLGWDFLQGNTDSSSTVNLKLEVYDLLARGTRSITLPVEFCGA